LRQVRKTGSAKGSSVKIHVDYARCTGNGLCEGIAEDVFEVGQDGQVHVLCDEVGADRRSEMQDAVDMCPTEALSITEGN
jgi:ferredoxin